MGERDTTPIRTWQKKQERWFLDRKKYENWKHPERKRGEMFLADILPSDATSRHGELSRLDRLPLRHKRVGNQSVDTTHRPLRGLRPLFVMKSELAEKGIVNIGFLKDSWLIRYWDERTETF